MKSNFYLAITVIGSSSIIKSILALSSSTSRLPVAYDLHTILNRIGIKEVKNDGLLCGGRIETISGLYHQSPLLMDRDVKVWLPPGYDSSSPTTPKHNTMDNNADTELERRYPVLYCHDGQNAIQDQDSWTGVSWRLARALTKLNDPKTMLPIVVLLPSATGDFLPGLRRRHLEYASLASSPFAVAHTDLVANTIKPVMDRMFRTDAAYAIGSSLGGQASMNLLLKYPKLFHGAACLSPYFSADTIANVQAAVSRGEFVNKKIYLDIGGDMDDTRVPFFDIQDHLTQHHWWNPGYFWLDTSLQASVTAMHAALQQNEINVQYRQFPGARHNERAWAERIHLPLLHILSK